MDLSGRRSGDLATTYVAHPRRALRTGLGLESHDRHQQNPIRSRHLTLPASISCSSGMRVDGNQFQQQRPDPIHHRSSSAVGCSLRSGGRLHQAFGCGSSATRATSCGGMLRGEAAWKSVESIQRRDNACEIAVVESAYNAGAVRMDRLRKRGSEVAVWW